MAPKTARSKMPLEWKNWRVNVTDATVTNFVVDLDLLQNEVAEIHKLDSRIAFANIPDAANDDLEANMMMSMDPDIDDSPAAAANHDDLEVFFEHEYALQQEIGAAGQNALISSDQKISDFAPPVLVGTNPGVVVIGDAAIAVSFQGRVYFTRRKASVLELNQILLKRR